jgi:hypothetical protein
MPFMRRYSTICPYWSEACEKLKMARAKRVLRDGIAIGNLSSGASALPLLSVAMAL